MWFFSGGFQNFQLDVVGFLAILGEGSVLSTAQVLGASKVSYIPRLIPAPNALFRSQRPQSLPSYSAVVSAIHSGNARSHVNYVAHLLLDKEMKPFTVRYVDVKKDATGPPLRVRTTGPMLWVTLLGFITSIALITISAALNDAMSLIATFVLSVLATLAGYANKWEVELQKRGSTNTEIPGGDLIVRYPNGSFLVVQCSEEVARELYFAPEEITYHQDVLTYQMISLLATSLLMIGVICLANAKIVLQCIWAGSFILLNAAYWLLAALPHEAHWDLSCYRVTEYEIKGGNDNKSYTEALWVAIAVAGSTEWTELGQPARPETHAWKEWVRAAGDKARDTSRVSCLSTQEELVWPFSKVVCVIPQWDAHEALKRVFRTTGAARKSKISPNNLESVDGKEGKAGRIGIEEQNGPAVDEHTNTGADTAVNIV